MLEVVNLKKVYKTKGGVAVNALDGVSVRFPERGMVFLLGKSGSGKSTLLNVCGGLDAPTDGEVIVKGRSSKAFSRSDFDSYRNTFIGFIFQEYNILNEFSVEDNIALALELQGKPKDKKEIARLLEQVDLKDYAKRKPNTLSGGQKQRIAIARALIKNPEIIMADEPTGALDSNTGKQVFDTLKKLSKEKLVIVVSHDRDFAEQYGDRIIELKDGKILEDITKSSEASTSLGENLSVVGENTLCVKNGKALTEKEIGTVLEFLKKTDGKAVITNGDKQIDDFKKVSRISDDGAREVFVGTNEEDIPKKCYSPQDAKFIRSKLPIRHAMKIGVSGMKAKPFRLIFTIFLATVSFVMFGLFSTLMLYDTNETLYKSLDDSKKSVFRLEKRYVQTQTYSYDDGDSYSNKRAFHTRFTESETNGYAEKFGDATFGANVIKPLDSYGDYDIYSSSTVRASEIRNVKGDDVADYYTFDLSFFAYVPESHPMRAKITSGNYPVNDDEICIPSYLADGLVAAGYQNAKSTQELIGKDISFDCESVAPSSGTPATFKIVGVFDCTDAEFERKYASLKEKATGSNMEERLKTLSNFQNEITDGMYRLAFVTKNVREKTFEYVKEYEKANSNSFENLIQWDYRISVDESGGYPHSAYFVRAKDIPDDMKIDYVNGKSNVQKGEAVLSRSVFYQLFTKYNDSTERQEYYNAYYNEHPEFVQWSWMDLSFEENNYAEENRAAAYAEYLEFVNAYKTQFPEYCKLMETVTFGGESGTLFNFVNLFGYGDFSEWSEQEKAAFTVFVLNELNARDLLSFDARVMNQQEGTSVSTGARTLTVVGVLNFTRNDIAFVCEEDYSAFEKVAKTYSSSSSVCTVTTKYTEKAGAEYDAVFVPYSGSISLLRANVSFNFDEEDSCVNVASSITDSLSFVNSLVEELLTVFMWIGIVMAVFSALLLSNFISVSISYKKREIGILRAVGARSLDVFKIFFSESFVIVLICIVLSCVGSTVGCIILNGEVESALSGISLFVFGPLSIAIIFGVAVLTAVVATFLPVFIAARKKPVESIRAL